MPFCIESTYEFKIFNFNALCALIGTLAKVLPTTSRNIISSNKNKKLIETMQHTM